MKLASIVPSSVMVFLSLGDVGGGDCELGIDFVDGVLGGGEAELALEEGGFGRIPIRIGEIQALRWIDELLGLLHEAREVGEHDS